MDTIKLRPINRKRFNPKNCAVVHTLSQIGGNWKPIIIWAVKFEINRFSLLLKELPISRKMLSKELRELEKNGILLRKSFPEVPPRVEYSLSEKGESVVPIIRLMCDWGENDMKKIVEKVGLEN